ncbi:type I methionyl aminopeptidase [Candidatus Peregrinibacteria bacterium]|nr:type I methionyl aminopeptidase [Candidatus Peregrinibacteria bacterium]
MRYWEENGLRIGIKNEEEMAHMRESGRILGIILAEIEQMIAPGITGLDIDAKAVSIMEKFNVKASFKGYQGFPNVACININNQVVHGIPTDRVLQEGDIITVDCGVVYKGFHSDSAISVGVGNISPEAQKLISTAEKALKKGIETAKAGIRVGKISEIIEKTIVKNGFSVVHDLIGHGIGTELHEDPPVPNFKDSDPGPLLQPGMTIAIEPIITAGRPEITLEKDNWTYITSDGSLATQVEHTIAITEKGVEILTKRPTL